MIVLICDLDNRNTFCTSPNQGLLLITEYVIALIGDCESVCGSYTSCCCCYRYTQLRLMWWNPHGEMICSAEDWQSQGERLTVSEACWTTYMFRTSASVCQQQDSSNPLCFIIYLLFFLPPLFSSVVIATAAAEAYLPQFSCFISHIWSLPAVFWTVKVHNG